MIPKRIELKLRDKHQVSPNEVIQCFCNRDGKFLEDTREEHFNFPPTQWFIANTDEGRRLKVVFVEDEASHIILIKTAYEPNAREERIYAKFS